MSMVVTKHNGWTQVWRHHKLTMCLLQQLLW